jgi:hypothetical protein
LLLSVALLMVCGASLARTPAHPQYRWERMSIVHVLPSQVFTKLGLTHTTRYGYTRDGHTKNTPDPTFPKGLTDVVPYDADHLLLVRGTEEGLTLFRARVTSTENEIAAAGRWHVTVALLPANDDGATIGSAVERDVADDIPFMVSAGDPANPHVYEFRVHVDENAAIAVSCRIGLSLASAPQSSAVWTPAQVWTPLVTRPVLPGGSVVFDDRAADRQDARVRLGMTPDGNSQDYQVRLTIQPPGDQPPPDAGLPASAAAPPASAAAPPASGAEPPVPDAGRQTDPDPDMEQIQPPAGVSP